MRILSRVALAIVATLLIATIWVFYSTDSAIDLTRERSLQIRAAMAEKSVSEDSSIVVYTGATLIDGLGGDPLEDAVLVTRNGKIEAVGKGIDIPEGSEIVDVEGKWIVPGLIDAHVHFSTSGRIYTRPGFIDLTHLVSQEEETQWIKDNMATTLRGYLCSGVTGTVSMGGPSSEIGVLALANSMADAPSVFVAHGPTVVLPPPMARSVMGLSDGELTLKAAYTEDQARELVEDAVATEADLVKTVYDTLGRNFMEWLQADYVRIHEIIVEESNEHGLNVTTHIHALEPGKRVMEAGISSMQHLPSDALVDDEFITLALDNDVIVVPTLALRERALVNSFDKQYKLLPIEEKCGNPEIIESWFEVGLDDMPDLQGAGDKMGTEGTRIALENSKTLYEAGVAVGAGTDAGLMGMIHGASMHLELQSMSEIGMTPGDLIVSATLTAARVAGIEKEYGSLEAGKYADFLILSANPLDNIANLQEIDVVVKHGHPFTQSDLLPAP